MGDFAEIGRARSIFTALAQTLQQASDDENDRRRDADAGVAWRRGDEQRAETHQQHRAGQRIAPSMPVGQIAEQRAAERAHQKSGREDGSRRQLLRHWIGLRKECAGEIERKRRIGVDVVPFDQISHRADQHRSGAAANVRRIKAVGCCARGSGFGSEGHGAKAMGCGEVAHWLVFL